MTGFSPRERDDAWVWRWMGKDAVWTIVNASVHPIGSTLTVELSAFHRARRLELLLDGQFAQAVVVDPARRSYHIGPLNLIPGAHALVFHPADAPTPASSVLETETGARCRLPSARGNGPCGDGAVRRQDTPESAVSTFLGRGWRALSRPGRRSIDALLRGNERRLFREHFPPLAGLAPSEDRAVGRGEEYRSWWGQPSGGACLRRRYLRTDGESGESPIPRRVGPAACSRRRRPGAAFPGREFRRPLLNGNDRAFDETERAVEEIARVLKPGGRAIVGVPTPF